jgi:hypothetical protein
VGRSMRARMERPRAAPARSSTANVKPRRSLQRVPAKWDRRLPRAAAQVMSRPAHPAVWPAKRPPRVRVALPVR